MIASPVADPDANTWPPARSYVTTALNAAEADVRRRTHIKRDDIRPQVLHQTETAALGA